MVKITRGQCILCQRESIPVIKQINCCQRCLIEAFRDYWEARQKKGGKHE